MLRVTAASGMPEVGEPAQKHPWWQVPAWVPVFLASVIENWCDAGPRESQLVGACSLQCEPKHWCVEENVSFDQK